MLIGVAGMVLIVVAWAVSLRDVPPPRLSLLYGAGSALLTLHSLQIEDPVFTLLNATATLLAIANLARAARRKR